MINWVTSWQVTGHVVIWVETTNTKKVNYYKLQERHDVAQGVHVVETESQQKMSCLLYLL